MSSLQKIRLICFIGILIFYYWLYFECKINIIAHDSIALSFFVHASAFMYSLSFFRFVRIPFVTILTALNVIGFAIAPANVDFNIFQLGKFNTDMFFHINLGYIIFYLCHFIFLHFQIEKHRQINQLIYEDNKKDALKQLVLLQNYALFFYVTSRIVTLPISGLNEFIELLTIGSLVIGFFNGTNSIVKNLITISLILFSLMQILLGGLIYPIIFFGLFISAIVFQYGLKTLTSKLFMILGIMFIIIFSILFNPVKMEYRQIDQSGKSPYERLVVISELILSNNKSSKIEDDKTTFWRLTYPISAISMVHEKTPSKVPFWEGESYYNLLYKFIPRFLWKDKPAEEMGQLFGHRYEVLDEWNFTTSMNTPIIAEAYMNFGWLGFYSMFIIMAYILARAVISSNIKSVKSDGTLKVLLKGLNVAIVLTFVIQWESNFSMVFGKLVILVIINFLIEWLSFRKQDSNERIHHLNLATTKK